MFVCTPQNTIDVRYSLASPVDRGSAVWRRAPTYHSARLRSSVIEIKCIDKEYVAMQDCEPPLTAMVRLSPMVRAWNLILNVSSLRDVLVTLAVRYARKLEKTWSYQHLVQSVLTRVVRLQWVQLDLKWEVCSRMTIEGDYRNGQFRVLGVGVSTRFWAGVESSTRSGDRTVKYDEPS